MEMNLYLIYLASVLSASGFSTYNYIVNKRRQLKTKNRNFVFKKNLSSSTRVYSSIGDTIPSIAYLGSTLLSLIPVFNIMAPSLVNNIYKNLMVDRAIELLYAQLNEVEIRNRYENGIRFKLLEECGYKIPEDLKEKEIDETSVKVSDRIKSDINEELSDCYSAMYPENEKSVTINDIVMLSDKELHRRVNISLKLTKNEDVDTNKVNRVSNR